MKNFLLACICILLLLPATLWGKRIVKVACVGNSITYGAGISNRDKNSYPAQLQYYLGDGYEVRNFGSNGATAQSDGDYPYIRTAVYNESKAFFFLRGKSRRASFAGSVTGFMNCWEAMLLTSG